MNEIEDKTNINNLIYEVRGVQVMLDSDLAKLYGCANGTKTINQIVKRNIDRFPSDFYFQLTKEEYYNILRSQVGTLELKQGRYVKYLPYVFTEQGTAQLASVLRTQNAAIISVGIARAFVNMRHFIKDNSLVLENVLNINNRLESHERKLINHDEKIEELFSKFENDDYKELIFFDGQMYDAYSKILDIFRMAKHELIIIDGYADKSILDMISKLSVKVLLITKEKCKLTNREINIYNSQYGNLKVYYSNSYHDRYYIIDGEHVFHSGSSINHAGKRTFSINKLEDREIILSLIKSIESHIIS